MQPQGYSQELAIIENRVVRTTHIVFISIENIQIARATFFLSPASAAQIFPRRNGKPQSELSKPYTLENIIYV